MSAFLLYITRCALDDRSEEITEQQIGVHVFKRVPGYDSAEDTIVRSTARLLRQRLALYYQEEGCSDTIRIQIPRGGYIPVFQQHILDPVRAPAEPPEPAEPGAPTESVVRSHLSRSWPLAAALALGAVLALLIQHTLLVAGLHSSATDPLWNRIFSDNQRTIFVTGDAGLNMFNNQAHALRQLSLDDYVSGSYLYSPTAQSPAFAGDPIASRRYVSIVDLDLADHLTQLSRFRRQQYEVRFPRELTAKDFRNANVILAGAAVYNPWVEMFDHNLNFHIVYDGEGNSSMYVTNLKPRPGEPLRYQMSATTHTEQGFGYIALTDNLEGNGKVLLIEGTTLVGVDAAASFLFNEAKMAPIMAQARSNGGSLSNFEVLLGATFLKSNSAETKILASRF